MARVDVIYNPECETERALEISRSLINRKKCRKVRLIPAVRRVDDLI